MRRLLLIALPYVVISMSACGKLPVYQSKEEKARGNNNSIDGSRSPGDKIDACSQITREEVEDALGRTVMEPTRGDELVSRREGALTSSCMFGSNEGFASLDVKQQDPASTTAWNAARSYGELKGLIFNGGGGQSSGRLEKVAGLGVDAFARTKEETVNYETTELRVLSKRTILTIRVNALASTSTLEAAKTLAGKVLSRLESYESNIIVAAPETPPTAPKDSAKVDKDERLTSSKRSKTEPKGAKKVERESERKATKTASSKGGKDVSRRRANEPSAKVSQKSAKRTADRGKKETRKTAQPSTRNRKRS